MRIDYSRLRGRMAEKGYTTAKLAESIGSGKSHMSRKLSGYYELRQSEIMKICSVLDISPAEIGDYFFVVKDVKSQQVN